MSDCIQNVMRCSCTTKTPKGYEYHPACKSVYERQGKEGRFVKVGYRCPNCGRWFDFED